MCVFPQKAHGSPLTFAAHETLQDQQKGGSHCTGTKIYLARFINLSIIHLFDCKNVQNRYDRFIV